MNILIVGCTYEISLVREEKLNLYISTLKKAGYSVDSLLISTPVFDYRAYHSRFFPEFTYFYEKIDEIHIFTHLNDPEDFNFLVGLICGQTNIPVKVLEELSDSSTELYQKLKDREGMNSEYQQILDYFSIKRALPYISIIVAILTTAIATPIIIATWPLVERLQETEPDIIGAILFVVMLVSGALGWLVYNWLLQPLSSKYLALKDEVQKKYKGEREVSLN